MKTIIIGAGKLGSKLAEAMTLENMDVVVVDTNPKVLERISEHLDIMTVSGNGLDSEMLKELNIAKFDLLVACTEFDETNAVICTLAKKLGCVRTIARVRNPEYTEQMEFMKNELGIDLIINPDHAAAKSISKYLLKDVVFYTGEFASGKVKMVDFNIQSREEFVGVALKNLKNFENLLVTAISRNGQLIIPSGITVLEKDDVIHVLGKDSDVIHFSKANKLCGELDKVKNAMILGGGKLGYYLAKELSATKVDVTIIEENKERAQKLVELLDHVLIIHGDGTDANLLEEEGMQDFDAFIGVTGYDEQNLLMALMAKQAGATKSIAKVSRQNYTRIIDKLNIDAAVNPVNIAASNILKYIRGGKVISVSLLLGGDGEVTEIVATPEMKYLNKPLSEVDLPKGVIIGAIIHDGVVSIAKGSSIIRPYDRIVVFSLAKDFESLRSLFIPTKGGLFNELWNIAQSTRFNTDY